MNLWKIQLNEYNNKDNEKYETLFTLANGYRGLRGTLEFSQHENKGNFIAGVYDKSESDATELVNAPNPLEFTIYIDEEKINFDECKIEKFNRVLNLYTGVLEGNYLIETNNGKRLEIKSEVFVSRSKVIRWASKYTVKSLNFTGKIVVENSIDGKIVNNKKDPKQMCKHFNIKSFNDLDDGIALEVETRDKGIKLVEGSAIKFKKEVLSREYEENNNKVIEKYTDSIEVNEVKEIYKYGISLNNRKNEEKLIESVKEELKSFIEYGYNKELEDHKKVWADIWNQIDIKIDGDEKAQLGIRFNLFHLSSCAYSGDNTVSIGAKGIHGEGYRGHVFWDTEIFMLPFFTYTMPEVAKSLLLYRYNTLIGARENAIKTGYKGARFPWESADDGSEATPSWGYDFDGSIIKIYTGDEEYHINSDIVFGIVQYFTSTYDEDFMINYGLEILMDTAKFWESRVEYNTSEDRYEISTVIGPDEFHEHINNNVYTNYLAKWSLGKSIEFVNWLKDIDKEKLEDLMKKLEITKENIDKWNIIKEKIYIPQSGDIIEQFEGYFDLDNITITEYDENGMPMWPNGIKGNKLNTTQIIKQADVVQLLVMLPDEFSWEIKKKNYEYYEARTMHKSSLSPSMYSIVGLSVEDRSNAYNYFMKTLLVDLDDNQGNSASGLHSASTGGAWQSAILGFAGLSVDKDDELNINPWIPEHWNGLEFNINWRNSRVYIKIEKEIIEITATDKINIKVNSKKYVVNKNEIIKISR